MTKSIKFIVYLLLFFGFLSIGTETFRIIKLNMDIEESIQIMLEDSIELAMDDRYRKDHISFMDTTLCREIFLDMLKDKYNLDNNLRPRGDSYLASPFNIRSFELREGSFKVEGNKAVQQENPSCSIVGHVKIKPIMLNFNKLVEVKFQVFAENKRED